VRGFSQIIVAVFVVIGILIVAGIFMISNKNSDPQYQNQDEISEISSDIRQVGDHDGQSSSLPSGLSLPFNIEDIDENKGEINPIGVVRFSKDEGLTGHSGVDIPLFDNSPVYAVSEGEIVVIKSAGDPWGGMGLYQILSVTGVGEGWGFIYEHIKIADGLEVGDNLKRGDLVGTKAAPAGFTAHFQLSHHFNNYEFTKDVRCWPDRLSSDASEKFISWWDKYRTSEVLLNSWKTNVEEGQYPFRGLLDDTQFPGGAQLCYELGTDVR